MNPPALADPMPDLLPGASHTMAAMPAPPLVPRASLSEEAWRALCRRYMGALRHTLRRRVALASDVDDLVQQALMQAVVGWPSFRGEAEVSTWVFGIARNLALHHVSRRGGPVQFGLDEAVDQAASSAPGPCECLDQRERMRCVQRGLDDMPVRQREALWLVGVESLSYEEAARSLQVSVAAIKHRVARARAALRERGC